MDRSEDQQYSSNGQFHEDIKQDQQSNFKVFQQDFYISGSFTLIQKWKQNIENSIVDNKIDSLKYLQIQSDIFDKQQNFLLAVYHIRYYCYAYYFEKAITNLVCNYKRKFIQQNFNICQINTLDKQLLKLSFYLEKIQLTRAANYISQIDNQILPNIYLQLRLLFPMIFDYYCVWRVSMLLQIMRQDQIQYVMNIPINMKIQFYMKTFKTLKFKSQKLAEISIKITRQIQNQNYLQAYLIGMKQLNKMGRDISEQIKCQLLCCLKYMYFLKDAQHKTQNNLFFQYITSSLKIPYYRKNQNMPDDYYENLFSRILLQTKNDCQLLNLSLYIDPNAIRSRKKQSFVKIQGQVLKLFKQVLNSQKIYLNQKINPQQQYLKKLLKPEQFAMLIQFMQTIMQFNKQIFLKADNQIYEIFLQMADLLKNIFLSFGKDLWLFPQNIFTPLTLSFFKKISEDINEELKNILYEMVQNLNQNKMPLKLTFVNQQFRLQKVQRLQYLSAIMYYIDDCSREQQYLNLPEIAPSNIQTSILLIKSFHVKLKHHEPNPTQLPLFNEYLKQCQKYKLNIRFSWFKQSISISERQIQFQIQLAIKQKQIRELLRKCLNFRDRQYVRQLIQERYYKQHSITSVQIANIIKYNHGQQFFHQISNICQQQIFMLIDQMNNILDIIPNNILDLQPLDQINISYLHYLLIFYNIQYKQVKGSEIYQKIFDKIVLNYLKAPFLKSNKFKLKYPAFFSNFIYRYHQLQICNQLNQIILSVFQHVDFQKNIDDWTQQQKFLENDLKLKIQIIRDEFLQKLQESQNQITQFVLNFTSIINQNMPSQIILECSKFLIKILIDNKFLGQFTNLNVFLNLNVYKKYNFFSEALKWFEKQQSEYNSKKIQIKENILKFILNSKQILQIIDSEYFLSFLLAFSKIQDSQKIKDLNYIFNQMHQKVHSQNIQLINPKWFLVYILLFFQQLNQSNSVFGTFQIYLNKIKNKQVLEAQLQYLYQILKKLQKNDKFWEIIIKQISNISFEKYNIFFQFLYYIKVNQEKKQIVICKKIWREIMIHLNSTKWIFYFMIKLNDTSLIQIHQNKQQMLINLIIKQKLTKQNYPIFKKIINETSNIDLILKKCLNNYDEQQNYPQNYQFHNKLILINEKYPNEQNEQKILKWIQNGDNKLPLKISQIYYMNFVKKNLKDLPDKIGQQLIFKKFNNPQGLIDLNLKIQSAFQILLYFPIKKIKNQALTKVFQEENYGKQEDQNEWQQNSQDQEEQINNKKSKKKQQYQNNSSQSESSIQNQSVQSQTDSQISNSYNDIQRPEIIDIFIQQNSEDLLKYKRFCLIREQIDIYIKSDYNKLIESPITDNLYLLQKLLSLQKELESMKVKVQQSIILHMPQNLYIRLKQMNYKTQRNQQKIKQLRRPYKKIIEFQNQSIFSDRGQSDEQYNNQQNQQLQSGLGSSSQQDSISDQNQQNYQELKQNQKEDQIQLPQLNIKFTDISEQIKGNELQKKQICKILQIFLIQIFRLSPVNFRKKQIIYSYEQIMNSTYSQLFFESVITVLRLQQNIQMNKNIYLKKIKEQLQKQQNKFSIRDLIGLSDFSMFNGLSNFIHLVKLMKQKGHYFETDQSNPFLKQSRSLLPLAQRCIIQFDLPLQTNIFSLALLYIKCNKQMRQKIQQNVVGFQRQPVQLAKKQIRRVCQLFLSQKTHFSAWQFIQATLNYNVSDVERLTISLDIYSKQVLKTLSTSALRIKQTIQRNKKLFKQIISQGNEKISYLKHNQRIFYITSNLLNSCSQEIRRFYFMNKTICRYLWQDDDENSHNCDYNKVPKKLKKSKQAIYTNQNFKLLLELSIRLIYYLKDQLYGKLSSKQFKRLIKFPKLIIQTATMYMHISALQKQDWNFKNQNTINKVISEYNIGQYKFKSIIQVYNLILGLLQIQSFCSLKFKKLLIPYFTQNINLGLQAPLMFKVPKIDDDINGQNILATRQCSFDMPFYQVQGRALFVQFYGQQGNDHGGIIRQLMMGWKGLGFGQQDFFIGKILGISFSQTVPYGGHIDIQMCIKITNYKVTLQRMEDLDKQVYKSLKYIKQNDPTDIALTFSINKKNVKTSNIDQYQLIPGGSLISLTDKNKQQYLELYLNKYFVIGRENELQQIATGFYTVVNKNYVSIFKPHQLMQHLKGQQIYDVNLLKLHTKYEQGYSETSIMIKWFWQILQNFNQQQLNRFIQFLTGSPKLPIFNPNFQIVIQRVFQAKNLPVAHTCFNTLDLPEYPTKQILQRNLITAIFQGNETFSIL